VSAVFAQGAMSAGGVVIGDDGVVVAVDGMCSRAWMQAADIIVSRPCSPRRARRCVAAVRDRYPGCVVVVARHHDGRSFLVGVPGHTFAVRCEGRGTGVPEAVAVGRAVHDTWITGTGGRP
jgi:hypothetical protein